MTIKAQTTDWPETKRKLVEAGVNLMRSKGFNATTVDDICLATEMTKGAFFHYFKSKEELAKAALLYFGGGKSLDLQAALFRKFADPLDRVFGRLDFVKDSIGGNGQLTKGCLIGMFAQELSFSHPELRSACQEAFLRSAEDFEKDLAEAKSLHAPTIEFDPKQLSLLYVSIFQGSSLMAKAAESNSVLLDNIEQFQRYLQHLFGGMPCLSRKRSTRVSGKSRN